MRPHSSFLRSRAPTRLQQLLLLSVGLHAAILWPWSPAAQLAGQAQTVLSVNLSLSEPVQAQEPAPAPAPALRHSRRAPASQRQPTQSVTAAATDANIASPSDAQEPSAPEATATASSTNDTSANASARAQIESLLLSDLRRHFEYPALARQRGWQGLVWLSVTIQPDGAVQDVRIAQSSGYAVLDRSAVASMRRVGPLAEATRWLNGRAVELPLPIVYRLTN